MAYDEPLSGRTAIVLTVSDRCFAGTQIDVSGPTVAKVLTAAGAHVLGMQVLPDEAADITRELLAAAARASLIVTTGGTGLALRDVTPEATIAACDRMVPGLSEVMRKDGCIHTPYAALGRGVCGTIGTALAINLPGSPRGAESSLRAVLALLPHALDLLGGHTEHPMPKQAGTIE
jgi:molybdenum cofactor synthesis domain-containing protein